MRFLRRGAHTSMHNLSQKRRLTPSEQAQNAKTFFRNSALTQSLKRKATLVSTYWAITYFFVPNAYNSPHVSYVGKNQSPVYCQ